MSKKKKNNAIDVSKMRCPYCGGKVVYRTADGIYYDNSRNVMLYVCSHYPKCDAYVRVHEGTNIPVGSLANHELRALRSKAHKYFDLIYETGIMSRHQAYKWLADFIGTPMSEAHIGYMGEYYCKQVIDRCDELLKRNAVPIDNIT